MFDRFRRSDLIIAYFFRDISIQCLLMIVESNSLKRYRIRRQEDIENEGEKERERKLEIFKYVNLRMFFTFSYCMRNLKCKAHINNEELNKYLNNKSYKHGEFLREYNV